MRVAYLLTAAGLLLAGGAGFLASTAIGQDSAATRTVTINVATGSRGPAGPPGPPGPKGDRGPAGLACPSAYSPGKVVINHPGGQTAIWACLED